MYNFLRFSLVLLLAQALTAWAAPSSARHKRTYDLHITWDTYAPDGFEREMLLVNGQSPGPVIEATQDEWVVVRVHNYSPFNTSVHYHGIEMRGTPWADGVPGVTQRPIAPGCMYTYEFETTQAGSYWYHAHFHGQIEDGLYGAMVLHPRKSDPKPFHLITNSSRAVRAMERAERHVQPLLVSDVTHLTSGDKQDITVAAGIEITCYDSVVFNGKGSVQCLPEEEVAAHLSPVQQMYLSLIPGLTMTDKACLPAEALNLIAGGGGNVSAIPEGVYSGCTPTEGSVEVIHAPEPVGCPSEQWVAIDIIGAINFMTAAVSIDEHDMWVYAMDGGYIEPQRVQALVLTNGDRYSVLVNARRAGDFKIRVNAVSALQMLTGHALLSVAGTPEDTSESEPFINIVGMPLSEDVVFFNQAVAHPYPADPIPETADELFVLNMKLDGASYLWAMNSSRLMPEDLDHRVPTLFKPEPNVRNNVTLTTRYGTWVDLVFFASTSPMPPHPIHKHGNKMYQIGAGTGPFPWSSVQEAMQEIPEQFNLVNPPRRDAFATLPAETDVGWIVVRYHVTNPGPWLLHCHINNHMMGGMMVIIQDAPEAWPTVPEKYRNYGM
ncbi:Cupredoxin [Stachybotrys elegans]|uniref:Cupredoxin n=1 Tax=Stachybotrys elegans TaxID=80388 RepID=A0A8K0SXV6_9HYPO|nr:Cupredoxin [Stachybotrys elegans]